MWQRVLTAVNAALDELLAEDQDAAAAYIVDAATSLNQPNNDMTVTLRVMVRTQVCLQRNVFFECSCVVCVCVC